jgi:Zn2+/Cd2+-exporting ATPase
MKDEKSGECSSLIKGVPTGVKDVVVNPEKEEMEISFDPSLASEHEVKAFASRSAQHLHERFETCAWKLKGHNCESCAERLEHRVESIPGVRKAIASFVGGRISVHFDPGFTNRKQLEKLVNDSGVKVESKDAQLSSFSDKMEIILTVIAGISLFSGFIAHHLHLSPWISNSLYLIAYITGGYFGVISGFQSLMERVIDVDLLMVLAALGAAYVGAPFEGGMLLFLFALSNVLQNHAMERSRRAIQSLMKLRPSEVSCKEGNSYVTRKLEEVETGAIIRVRPGENIALDGIVVSGESAIDESSITGESMPLHKTTGSQVYAGTINQTGSLEYEVTKCASDSTLAKIIDLVEDAQAQKASTQRFLEKAEQHYALGVILLTIGLIIFPPLLGTVDFAANFYRAMTVMVVASPCALVISTPAAFLSAIGGAARSGVLFKGGVHLERLAEVEIVAFDKTGTLTEGKPRVMDVVPALAGGSKDYEKERQFVLQIAASVEALSEHPLARAIEEACKLENLELKQAVNFNAVPGKGAFAFIDGIQYLVGSPSLFRDRDAQISSSLQTTIQDLQMKARTLVLLGKVDSDGKTVHALGIIAIADQLRVDADKAVLKLKKLGIKWVVMLTGDNRQVAEAIGKQARVDEVFAELLPEDKVTIVKQLSRSGPVAMVGDGVNDAPALASSHVGIAMGAAGTDVAMETADIVLMSSNLHHLEHAIGLAHKSRQIVTQNLVFALGVIVVLVLCALTIGIPLPLGVVGHEGSTVLVCLNGLRLLGYKTPTA